MPITAELFIAKNDIRSGADPYLFKKDRLALIASRLLANRCNSGRIPNS